MALRDGYVWFLRRMGATAGVSRPGCEQHAAIRLDDGDCRAHPSLFHVLSWVLHGDACYTNCYTA